MTAASGIKEPAASGSSSGRDTASPVCSGVAMRIVWIASDLHTLEHRERVIG
jgi:hypothetical protein